MILEEFLTPLECGSICEELRHGAAAAATVLAPDGRRVANTVRRASVADPSASSAVMIRERLERLRPEIATHFSRDVGAIEAAQFLHYRRGDFFVAHQDGNTPLIRDASLHRKVSVIIFLNAAASQHEAGYRGGELVFHSPGDATLQRRRYALAAGTLLAFPSETTHEVLPIEDGERFTIVSWYLDSAAPAPPEPPGAAGVQARTL